MKTMNLKITKKLLFLPIIALIGFYGCKKDEETSTDTSSSSLVGKWETIKETDKNGTVKNIDKTSFDYTIWDFGKDSLTYIFYSNSVVLNEQTIDYSTNKDTLFLIFSNGSSYNIYNISGSTLTIKNAIGTISELNKL